MEECVSAILLQLILLPFSPSTILVSPYVYVSTPPLLPLLKLDMEECVSAILLQLIHLPFSPAVILESPYVYLFTPPPLPLSIGSPLFVYLS